MKPSTVFGSVCLFVQVAKGGGGSRASGIDVSREQTFLVALSSQIYELVWAFVGALIEPTAVYGMEILGDIHAQTLEGRRSPEPPTREGV